MSNVKYAVALKNQRLTDINTSVGASGFLKGYSGTQPTNPDTALSSLSVLLFNLPLSSSFLGTPISGGVATANAISTESAADGTGTLGFASITTSSGGRIIDMDVGTSGASLNINSLSISSGAQVSCSSMTITAGN